MFGAIRDAFEAATEMCEVYATTGEDMAGAIVDALRAAVQGGNRAMNTVRSCAIVAARWADRVTDIARLTGDAVQDTADGLRMIAGDVHRFVNLVEVTEMLPTLARCADEAAARLAYLNRQDMK